MPRPRRVPAGKGLTCTRWPRLAGCWRPTGLQVPLCVCPLVSQPPAAAAVLPPPPPNLNQKDCEHEIITFSRPAELVQSEGAPPRAAVVVVLPLLSRPVALTLLSCDPDRRTDRRREGRGVPALAREGQVALLPENDGHGPKCKARCPPAETRSAPSKTRNAGTWDCRQCREILWEPAASRLSR